MLFQYGKLLSHIILKLLGATSQQVSPKYASVATLFHASVVKQTMGLDEDFDFLEFMFFQGECNLFG